MMFGWGAVLMGALFVVLAAAPGMAAPAKSPAPSSAPRAAPAKSTPVQTVQALYASLPRPTPPVLLSRRLRALAARDESRRDRHLDFEWRSGGQDSPDITGFRLRVARIKGDAALVEASFYNRGERRFRRFFMVREAGRWVVDDALLVPENGKLSDFLNGKG
jgi:hypothetical protein